MANSARNKPGAQRKAQQEPNPLDVLQVYYEKNKKTISSVTTVVLVIVVGYLAYTKLIKEPNEEKAATAISYAQSYFTVDSLNLALNGDGQHLGFARLAKKYDGTAAGNLALYYEGICYLKMGNFPSAIKALNDFNGKGTMVAYQAWGALGEAYKEIGNNAKAIENFKKATEDKDDLLVTPVYLYQLGVAYEDGGKINEAKEAFKRIRDEYPRSMQARDIDKELARLGEVN